MKMKLNFVNPNTYAHPKLRIKLGFTIKFQAMLKTDLYLSAILVTDNRFLLVGFGNGIPP